MTRDIEDESVLQENSKSKDTFDKYNFPQIKEANLKVRIQEEIRNFIINNQLIAGDPLPTEKEFSEKLGISRTVVREALNGLELIGLIEAKQGIGRFVGKVDVDSMVKNLAYTIPATIETFRDLLEVRITLETAFLLRDLAHFTDEDISGFYSDLKRQRDMIEKQCPEEDLIKAHAEFHSKLFYRSDNQLLVDLINMFSQVQVKLNRQHQYVTRNRFEYYDVHKSLVDAIATKEPELVKKCIIEHFLEPVEQVEKANIRISIPCND